MRPTYRTFTLRVPITLTWRQLFRQFGADPAKAGKKGSVSRFRGEVLRELKKMGLSGFPNPCLLMQCLEFNDKHGLRSHC